MRKSRQENDLNSAFCSNSFTFSFSSSICLLNYSMQFFHLAFILRSGLRGTLLQYLRQKILNFLKITEELLYVIALERYSIPHLYHY
jgi:hypothetical protein